MTHSQQIEQDLRDRLLAGEAPPFPLTLGAIARHYRVSLMPARVAVEALVSSGLLSRRPNGRLAINRDRLTASRGAVRKPTRPPRQSPDKRIADHVIQLSLAGGKVRLREEVTAEKFNIGRTVLRRIFNRLAGEGLIEHLPRRGWQVRPYREKDMLDYLELRETLELHALDLAGPRLDRAALEEHLAANQPLPSGEPHLDNRLHRLWIDGCANRYIREFFDQHGVYFQTLFDRGTLGDASVERAAAEHRRILQALLAGDRAQAREVLSAHILGQRANVARLFAAISKRDQTARRIV